MHQAELARLRRDNGALSVAAQGRSGAGTVGTAANATAAVGTADNRVAQHVVSLSTTPAVPLSLVLCGECGADRLRSRVTVHDRPVGERVVGDRAAGDRAAGDRAAGDRAAGDRAVAGERRSTLARQSSWKDRLGSAVSGCAVDADEKVRRVDSLAKLAENEEQVKQIICVNNRRYTRLLPLTRLCMCQANRHICNRHGDTWHLCLDMCSHVCTVGN